ncbi:carboxy terminal-processing peptidase [Tichowtungia aerotolerans]|uniref:Tail-specific protease n=1 Tax=Tichowtungia aerotolerans TaxID=2697043 RepID=A0A6P1MF98_9BACT|nr:carboxy terminal-processing peptidase [Tichowtungia aerotolerans]QHI70688.1 tail-specific protease [Tichowtungia aerotolerans]
MYNLKHYLLLPLIPALLCSCAEENKPEQNTSAPVVEKIPLPIKRIASRVADRLPHTHLNRMPFNDSIATNALMLFIDSFDFDHSYFLASDIEEFQQSATQLDDQVRNGDISFSSLIVDRFKDRVTNRVAYVNQLLDEGFDLSIDESYRWKRDDAPWPKGEAAWDELWRKKIKNEYVGRIAMKEIPEPEAKKADTKDLEEENLTEDEMLEPDEFIRERYKQFQLMVQNNFDEEAVLERYLSAFTQSYDPHSAYLSPRGVEDFDIHMSLSLVGIGAMLRSEDGAAEITKIIPGGPAEADGRLKPGDKIIAVAQGKEEPVSILYWPLSKAVRLIRGEKGTEVVLTIIPAEDKTGTRTKKLALIRDEVKLEEQAAKSEVYDNIGTNALPVRLGVITLPEFYADFAGARNGKDDVRRSSVDVRNILNQFATNDVDGVILDLRNDGGGSLTEAIDIAGQFIPLGPVVQVREQRGVAVLPDGDPTTVYAGPLIVLVNRTSASASEIVAAALQDYGRAVIVGDSKTHGKGTVQTVLPLSRLSDDLGSLKVTTAGFYRIAGGSTQLRGVTPDIVLPSLFDSLEIGEEFLPNALPWSQVQSAYYRPWRNSVKPLLPELQIRSQERMRDNPEFRTFMARRERLRERMETPTVSLKLSKRVDEILAEQELENLQDSMVETDNGEDKKEEDPILDEALRILTDLTELSSGGTVAADIQRP